MLKETRNWLQFLSIEVKKYFLRKNSKYFVRIFSYTSIIIEKEVTWGRKNVEYQDVLGLA